MIWVSGQLVADDRLSISVLDRTFEHGLGLFETLRTWRGRAPLLDRHLDRLIHSAAELGIPVEVHALPDDRAVALLLAASRTFLADDALLRITLSGGLSETQGSTLWMVARPLPAPTWTDAASVVVLDHMPPPGHGSLAKLKSLNYLDRRRHYDKARQEGFDEALLCDRRIPLEGSRTNLFAVRESGLRTPSTALPIVPGIMRGVVMEEAMRLGMGVEETELSANILEGAEEVFLTNSVRGIIPVGRLVDQTGASRPASWIAPGPCTRALETAVASRFSTGAAAS